MSVFLAFLTQISDRRPLAALREVAGRFPAISGVGDAGNRKFGVIPVKTGRIQPANVGFSRSCPRSPISAY